MIDMVSSMSCTLDSPSKKAWCTLLMNSPMTYDWPSHVGLWTKRFISLVIAVDWVRPLLALQHDVVNKNLIALFVRYEVGEFLRTSSRIDQLYKYRRCSRANGSSTRPEAGPCDFPVQWITRFVAGKTAKLVDEHESDRCISVFMRQNNVKDWPIISTYSWLEHW